jgi:hypothetical protein
LNAVVGECFTNVVKLEWLDDSGDEFHPGSPLLARWIAAWPPEFSAYPTNAHTVPLTFLLFKFKNLNY